MKRIAALLLILLLIPVLTLAETAPANPMFNYLPAPRMTQTPEPEETATPEPTATATAEPTVEPVIEEDTEAAPIDMESQQAAPALPENDYVADDILDEEMIAQLDAEVRDYLIGTGKLIDTVDGIRNILLVGVDARPGETQSRSDTVVILTIDGNTNSIRLTSILRDLYVSIPGHGNNRFNAAWAWGKFDLLQATIRENFGLEVTEYVTVDMSLLSDLIDQIGGLTLTVESKKQLNAINGVIDAYNYQFRQPNNDGLLTELGEQLMNGKQVQAYARYRKIDSDFKRSERQREVLTLIFQKLQTMSLFEISKLAAYAMERVETNMTLSDVISLIPIMFNMKDAEITQLTLPHDGEYQSKTVSGMAVLVPNLTAAQDRLEKFIYGEQ